jgi:uncharacterized protein (TIGR02391 family)
MQPLAQKHLIDIIPDAAVVTALEPEELGLVLLRVLGSIGWPLEAKQFIQLNVSHYRGAREIAEAVAEAWAWLEGQALLVPDRDQVGSFPFRKLSRKAQRLAREADPRRELASRTLPKQSLHPTIREDVWSLFVRGKFPAAVFEAMKAVEVAVREAAGLEARDVGTHLMRKAFDPENGRLTDRFAERAEREARASLFAGAIGAYKNPHSHRNVELNDPAEAVEILLQACLLLRIVDYRRELNELLNS